MLRATPKRSTIILAAALMLPLAGCGVTEGERAATGGAIGAGTGAAGAALTGGSATTGAILGGAAGAAAGALTDAEDIYLGEPFWR